MTKTNENATSENAVENDNQEIMWKEWKKEDGTRRDYKPWLETK